MKKQLLTLALILCGTLSAFSSNDVVSANIPGVEPLIEDIVLNLDPEKPYVAFLDKLDGGGTRAYRLRQYGHTQGLPLVTNDYTGPGNENMYWRIIADMIHEPGNFVHYSTDYIQPLTFSSQNKYFGCTLDNSGLIVATTHLNNHRDSLLLDNKERGYGVYANRKAYKNGYYCSYFAIEPYKWQGGEFIGYYDHEGDYLVNGFLVEFPKCEVVGIQNGYYLSTNNPEQGVKIGYNLYAVGATKVLWQRSIDGGKNWVTMRQDNVTEADAREYSGLKHSAHAEWEIKPDYRKDRISGDLYRLQTIVDYKYYRDGASVYDYSELPLTGKDTSYYYFDMIYYTYDVEHYVNGNNSHTYKNNVGDTIRLRMAKRECVDLTLESEYPIEYTTEMSGGFQYVIFVMPACDVKVYEKDTEATYEIQFIDYDGTMFDIQDVACGNYTKPVEPSHAGMKFHRWWSWSGETIYPGGTTLGNSDKVFYAEYHLEDLETVATQDHHSADDRFQGSETQIMLGDTIYFGLHLTSPLVTRIWAQITRDGGKTWESTYNYDLASNVAAAGYDVTPVWYPFGEYINNTESFGFRWKINSGDRTYYTTPYMYTIYSAINFTCNNVTVALRMNDMAVTLTNGESASFPTKANDSIEIIPLTDHNECVKYNVAGNCEETFKNDNNCIVSLRKNCEITFEAPIYKVYFEVIGCGKPLGINNVWAISDVPCAGSVEAPDVPYDPNFKETTVFDYWMDESTGDTAVFSDIYDDMWVVAEFKDKPEAVYYTVTYLNWDGSELLITTVEAGADAMQPVAPTREGYIFIGWDGGSPYLVSQDLTLTAKFEQIGATPEIELPEAIRDILAEHDVPTQKILVNGKFYIISSGRIYDAQGRLVE